jgi:hypothetical protein
MASPLVFRFGCSPRIVSLELCLVAALLVGLASVAAGEPSADGKREKPYALIFGTVWGPDNRPLYAVKIKVRRRDEKKARWEVYSDHHGEFAQRVPAGKQDYILWPDLKDYKYQNGGRLQGEEVKVHVEGDERVDTGLHLK